MRDTRRSLVRRRLLGPGIAMLAGLAVLLSGCADTYQVAASVGDSYEVSHSDLADEVALWSQNADLLAQVGVQGATSPAAAPQSLAGAILTLQIQAELVRLAVDDVAVTPEQQDAVDQQLSSLRADIEAQFGALFADFPEDLRSQWLDDIAALQLTQSMDLAQPDADVFVSPRYGTFDPATAQVLPPTGASAAPLSAASLAAGS